jgi:outer membrane protein TolC
MKKAILISYFLLLHLASWAQYNINYFVDQAIKNSPLIKENNNLSEISKLEIDRLKAFYLAPQANFTGNYLFSPILSLDGKNPSLKINPDAATKYLGYDLASSNGGTYQALFNVNQPLFNQKKYEVAAKQSEIASSIYQNNARISEHDLSKIIADQYILCYQNLQQIEYLKGSIDLLEVQLNMMKSLVEASIYKQSDLNLIYIEQQNFRTQLSIFEASYARDLLDLKILAGMGDTTLFQLQKPEISLNPIIYSSLFSKKYELDSLNLYAQQDVSELKYKPQFVAFANSGLNAVYAPTLPARLGFSLGFSYNISLYDGNQKNINRAKNRILSQSIANYKTNFETQNTLRKNKILNEIESYVNREESTLKQINDYENLLKGYTKEILSGQLSVINYITVLKNKAIVQRDYSLMLSQKQLLINTYNYWNW